MAVLEGTVEADQVRFSLHPHPADSESGTRAVAFYVHDDGSLFRIEMDCPDATKLQANLDNAHLSSYTIPENGRKLKHAVRHLLTEVGPGYFGRNNLGCDHRRLAGCGSAPGVLQASGDNDPCTLIAKPCGEAWMPEKSEPSRIPPHIAATTRRRAVAIADLYDSWAWLREQVSQSVPDRCGISLRTTAIRIWAAIWWLRSMPTTTTTLAGNGRNNGYGGTGLWCT